MLRDIASLPHFRLALICLSIPNVNCSSFSHFILSQLFFFSLDEPLSLDLPYELTEVSLSSLCPIAWASASGATKLILRLRAAGADVNAVDLEGRTPLMIALLANKEAAVEV